MTKKYFVTLDDALKAIRRENAKQAAQKTFYNIALKKTKNNNYVVIIG